MVVRRRVKRVETPPRLPIWPVANGVIFTVLEFIGLKALAKVLEDKFGGRVAPMMLEYEDTNPFILAVHHRHSFAPLDVLRPVSKFILPEGFPAHPHRGFETITYVIKGGFSHRDSLGVKMRYWAEKEKGDFKPAIQWLTTGKGVLHEEMWDVSKGIEKGPFEFLGISQQELFQIWLNLPSREKLKSPRVQLFGQGSVDANLAADFNLGDLDEEMERGEKRVRVDGRTKRERLEAATDAYTSNKIEPLPIKSVSEPKNGVRVRVLSGSYGGVEAYADAKTDISLLHVTLTEKGTWRLEDLPISHSAFFYVRSGRVKVKGLVDTDIDGNSEINTHQLGYFERGVSSEQGLIEITSSSPNGADLLFFAGEQIPEPIATAGSMVMNYDHELSQAYRDYEAGLFGEAWSEILPDDEWKRHLKETSVPLAAARADLSSSSAAGSDGLELFWQSMTMSAAAACASCACLAALFLTSHR
eukprot:CAMPEP_0184499702 /NCGR_PEP_ID=MMETSP0113_2-20130426/42273_1 /TAXON_ID=91329 /ORGANISM="Norrisiella sphaerica, Strain BC52" /LENGTH=471 /DNA_ID=CAMNT_0026887713 /DNA_START=256 /DNA_END=1668 /DNA_ORIENTATION=-